MASGMGALLVSMLFLVSAPARGQEGPITFEFSFSNPGARAMGLGGAFAALADDATAAFANPAGLVQLLEPEISLVGRYASYETPYVEGGRANGNPSGEGIDTEAGLRLGTSKHDETDVTFLSLVWPWDRVSLAAYRHTWADFVLESRVNGLFGVVDEEVERSEDVETRTELQVINTGLAIAFELTETLSLGLGIVYFDGHMDALSVEYQQDEDAFFGLNAFTAEQIDTIYSYQSATSGWVGHGGILWRMSPQWSMGAYYRQGPTLDLHVLETTGPAADEAPEGTIELDIVTPLHLPDVWGAGIAYRTRGGRFTASAEWARIEYSSIAESFDGAILDPGQISGHDENEYHLGVEYVLPNIKPIIAIRAGTWLDPAHAVASGPEAELFESTIFQLGDDEIHYSGGLGLVFRKVQIDLGVDLSDTTTLASISLVARF